MKIIKIQRPSDGKFFDVKVDDEDYDSLQGYDWIYKNGYAVVNRTYERMHRMLMGVPRKDPTLVDHINNDRLDNRRQNLRLANRFQNQQNRKTNKNNIYPKGIRRTAAGRYNVRIQTYNERRSIGSYDTLEEAVKARNKAARDEHGEFFNPSYMVEFDIPPI